MSLLLGSRRKWNEADLYRWALNDVIAVNPLARLSMSMTHKLGIDGLFKIYYPDDALFNSIRFERLYEEGRPHLLHNAWNLSQQKLQLFSNKGDRYKQISAASMCACSSLPYVEKSVEIEGDMYCTGIFVDTANFKALLAEHPDLDEIWIIRFSGANRYREPKTLHDSFGNFTQLHEATLAEDDVKLFKFHLKRHNEWPGQIVEVKNSRGPFD